MADTYKGWLLEKRTYDSDAYLTHLDDQGQNLSGYGETTHWTRMDADNDGSKTTRRGGPGQQKVGGA